MEKLSITLLLVITACALSAFVPLSEVNFSQGGVILKTPFSNDEIAGLMFMREEEKLAQDLYIALYKMYGLQAFQSIAGSELTHTNAIKSLLDRYGIVDPAAQTATGVFRDPGLQNLYNHLLTQGSQSLAEAIKVGAAVEEMDIFDLQSRIEQTSQVDILQVYANLEAGSRNHLRAFVFQLKSLTGEEYISNFFPLKNTRALSPAHWGTMDREDRVLMDPAVREESK